MVIAVHMDAGVPRGISKSESFGGPTYPRHSVCKIYSRETLLRIMQAAKTMMNGCNLDISHQPTTGASQPYKEKWT